MRKQVGAVATTASETATFGTTVQSDGTVKAITVMTLAAYQALVTAGTTVATTQYNIVG